MNDATPGSEFSLRLDQRIQLDRLCDEFEKAWIGGNGPSIEEFLERRDEVPGDYLLLELVAIDLERRRHEGDAPQLSDYLRRFPGFGIAVRSAFELVQTQRDTVPSTTANARSESSLHRQVDSNQDAGALQRIDRYLIERVLGRGGMATVYLALDADLNRQVALKVPMLDQIRSDVVVECLIREARHAAALDHPGIVRIHDVQQNEDTVYIVQQYVDGCDLSQSLKEGALKPERAARLMIEVAEAVGYAHRRGFVHRDLKPANILIGSDGKPRVADFGLAFHESDQVGLAGQLAGTRPYMSPEQLRGESHRLDGRSDLWSLGVVFYECLTGRRPFAGTDSDAVIDAILHRDPRPPRQVDPTVPPELARICMRCLAKRAADRYQSAADFIDDLQHWLSDSPPTVVGDDVRVDATRTQDPKLLPKGLRSFDAQDADFFLQLLPGPVDRNRLPQILRDWKSHLEARVRESTFPVGLIYGPSGCGKTSLVKSGLIPRLSADVLPIYVEATAAGTEERLRQAILDQQSELDEEHGLVELIAHLRGTDEVNSRKVVLIVDQFEQWLQTFEPGDDHELVDALRQCDGTNVACVLMVRDDFWMSITRFMKALEIPLVEGKNSQSVDLFDLSHARRVLMLFGQAYGRLPAPPDRLSAEQEKFLDRAIDEIAEEGQVICIRLSVFAQMMKGKAWTTDSLHRVGGASGLGVALLEESFSARTAPPNYRAHAEGARKVLGAMLPETLSVIKGNTRTRRELLDASGYGKQTDEFGDLLRILDQELRLITPTETVSAPREEAAEDGNSDSQYQLTHDYLVPSLRDWLTRKQRETRRGRAELRLAERSAIWNAKPEARQLPSLIEWASISVLTRQNAWSAVQRQMMRAASRRHLLRSAALLTLALFVGLAAYATYSWSKSRSAVEMLLAADAESVSDAAEEASRYPLWTRPQLQRVAAEETDSPAISRRRLNALLALARHDDAAVMALVEHLLETEDFDYVDVIRHALESRQDSIAPRFWSEFRDPESSVERRFRAGLALAGLAADSADWTAQDFAFLSNQLVEENPLYQIQIWPLLTEIKEELVTHLTEAFEDTQRSEDQRISAAMSIAYFAPDRPALLSQLLVDATPRQYEIIYARYERVAGPESNDWLRDLVHQQPELGMDTEERVNLGRRRAGAAITLLHQGDYDSLMAVLDYQDDPEALTQFVNRCRPRGIEPRQLLAVLAEADQRRGRLDGRRDKSNDSVMYALLLTLGEYQFGELPEPRDDLIDRLAMIYAHDPSSGVHSATGWLLRRWGRHDLVESVDHTALDYDPSGYREWFVEEVEFTRQREDPDVPNRGKLYFTMIVFPPGEVLIGTRNRTETWRADELRLTVRITRPYALCDRELTWKNWMAIEGGWRKRAYFRQFEKPITDEMPVFGVQWFEMITYCRWLGFNEGLSEDDQCYEKLNSDPAKGEVQLDQWIVDLDAIGFRPTTEAEWEAACRSGTSTEFSFGNDIEWLGKYSWHAFTANEWLHPVAQLRPNPRGLFDVHGNLSEWCHDTYGDGDIESLVDPTRRANSDKALKVTRGGAWIVGADPHRSSNRNRTLATGKMYDLGFRLARGLPAE